MEQEQGNNNNNVELIKGPWTKAEDELLKQYVQKYGQGNWDQVQMKVGRRCGKSCRFRWINHLHSDLRQEKISEEEKQKIFQLYKIHGSKWSIIAQQMSGRTDNEIKNFWNNNQRKKRKSNELPFYNQIIKSHDDELNNYGESGPSGFSNKQEHISNIHDEVKLKNDNCNIKHPSNSFYDIPIMRPTNNVSNMPCNNGASTSISNNISPPLIKRSRIPFTAMTMVPPVSKPLNFQSFESPSIQNMERKKYETSLCSQTIKLHDNELNNNGEGGLSGFNNKQQHISNTNDEVKLKNDNCNIKHPSNSFYDIPIMRPSKNVSNMLCNNEASTSTNNNIFPPLIKRSMQMTMVSNLPPLQKCSNFQSFESLIHKYPPLPLRTPEEIQLEEIQHQQFEPNSR